MKQTSKNGMLYRGRYIRRCTNSCWAAECYIIGWPGGGSEREMWYGSLKALMKHLDETVRFFGKWDRLL